MATEIAIALPFTLTAQGTVAVTSDQNKIWQDRVYSVLATSIGERVHRYNFGTSIVTQQFNSADEASEIIKNDVADAFSAFLPLLKLTDVSTTFSQDDAVLNVSVQYQLPNNQTQSQSIGQISLNGSQPFQEG